MTGVGAKLALRSSTFVMNVNAVVKHENIVLLQKSTLHRMVVISDFAHANHSDIAGLHASINYFSTSVMVLALYMATNYE